VIVAAYSYGVSPSSEGWGAPLILDLNVPTQAMDQLIAQMVEVDRAVGDLA
jgi:hypothetical protein